MLVRLPGKMPDRNTAPENGASTQSGSKPSTAFVLDAEDLHGLRAYLKSLGWLPGEALLRAERIGDGNMNITVRVRTDRGSYVLKQAMPWVVKYPDIPAPAERAAVEAEFYRLAAGIPGLAASMAALLGFDPGSRLLLLEDLGDGGDFMEAYRTGRMETWQCAALTDFLARLHVAAEPARPDPLLRNRAMRELNHEHQYCLPLRPDNGIDLDKITPGLAALASKLKADRKYCRRIAELGDLYLKDGHFLVHGDFFPGSWLITKRGIAVIDFEFFHFGLREYDLGIFLAHLALLRSRHLWKVVAERYREPVNWPLALRFAGAEIMRRLIGVAQLPLPADFAMKRAWLKLSREWVCAE